MTVLIISNLNNKNSIFIFQSDNPDNEKSNFDIDNQGNDNGTREYVSSPGYDTSSTHPPSSPDLCEYTYEGAIQDYKSRVSRAQKSGFTNNFYSDNNYPKDSNHESNGQAPRKQTSAEIENRLSNFEAKTSTNEIEKNENLIKKNLPKVDIARRRELFEKDKVALDKQDTDKVINTLASDFSQTMSIKERLMNLESRNDSQDAGNTKVDCLNTEFGSVKHRLLDIENAKTNQNVQPEKHTPIIDVPVISLKDRLSTLQEMVPSNANENVKTNSSVISTEATTSSDEQTIKINNENISNNNHVPEKMEENFAESEETSKTSLEVQKTETVEQPALPSDDDIQEQPNRLLSTINEAIHLVEDQPSENIVKRDASVSSPNLFKNHVLDDIVVDNDVIDDVDDTTSSNTNLKSYLVMDSTSDNIVHNSLTDDTTGNTVLTYAGESLCTSSDATTIISDCCRQQSINNEISNKVDVTMCLRSPNDESKTVNSLNDEFNLNVQNEKPIELEPVAPAQNGQIKLNFFELHPTEENRKISPLSQEIMFTDRLEYLANSSVSNTSADKRLPTETFIQNNISTTPVEILSDSSDSSFNVRESSESKNNRIKCQIVGVLEKHKCPNDNTPSRSDLTVNTTLTADGSPSPDLSLQSPSKSPYKSSKTIFDFIKRNLLNDPLPDPKDGTEVHSTFYVPLIEGNDSESKQSNPGCDSDIVDESTEINILIDQELEKLD